MKRLIAGLICFALAAGSGKLFAQQHPHQNKPVHMHGPVIHKHEMQQQKSIKAGVHRGELTRREAAHLQMEQAKIQYAKKVAKIDGHVSPRERKFIRSEQKKAAKHIYMRRHNAHHR